MVLIRILDSSTGEYVPDVDYAFIDIEGNIVSRGKTNPSSDGHTDHVHLDLLPNASVFMFLAKEGYRPRWLGPLHNDYLNLTEPISPDREGYSSYISETAAVRLPGLEDVFTIHGPPAPVLPPLPGFPIHGIEPYIGAFEGVSSETLEILTRAPKTLVPLGFGNQIHLQTHTEGHKYISLGYGSVVARLGEVTLLRYKVIPEEDRVVRLRLRTGSGPAPQTASGPKPGVSQSIAKNRERILAQAPALQQSIQAILRRYADQIPNDPESQKFVLDVEDISRSFDSFVTSLRESKESTDVEAATTRFLNKFQDFLRAFESTMAGDIVIRLGAGTFIMGIVSCFASKISADLAFSVLSVAVFHREGGKILEAVKACFPWNNANREK